MYVGGHNRAAIVGVGGWGARVVAHLWPRLRLADRGRALAGGRFRISRLSNMVSYALVLPDAAGNLTIARPNPERWADVGFARHHWELPDLNQSVRHLQDVTYEALWPTLDVVGRYDGPAEQEGPVSRLALCQNFLHHRPAITTDLAAIIEAARVDESEPDEESSQLTIFVVASLADEQATALLWPLTALLRNRVGDTVLAEQVGLLSSGVYAPPQSRRREEAAVYTAVGELAHLTDLAAPRNGDPASPLYELTAAGFPPAPPFDRTYLVDREKISGALVKDEGELTTVVGNALEAFLTADVNVYLRNVLAPDAADLLRSGPYSGLGAACVYVPLDELWTQARQRLSLNLLRDHFLAPLPEETEVEAARLAENFVQTHLDVSRLSERLLGSDTVRPAPEDGDGLPRVRVTLPAPALANGWLANDDASSRIDEIHERFDRLEREELARWAADLKERGRALLHGGDDNSALEPLPVLKELDQQILDLISTHDQGVQAGLIYTAGIVDRLRAQQDSLAEQRRQWQARPAFDEDTEPLQRRLAWTQRVAAKLPSWPLILGAGAFLALLAVAALLIGLYPAMGIGPSLAWAAGSAALVLLLGLIARPLYRRWLRANVESVAVRRRNHLDVLARSQLSLTLETLLATLAREINRREQSLRETLQSLQRDRDSLADRLSQPLTTAAGSDERPRFSFVRRPLAQDDLYEDLRSQPPVLPDSPMAGRVFQTDPASSEAVRLAWQRATRPADALAHRNGASPSRGPSLAEALSLAIERYAAHLSRPEAPADINVADLLPRAMPQYNASDFLADLRTRAKPLIRLDDRVVTSPIGIDLMAIPSSPTTQTDGPAAHAAALRLRLLASYDPFSLILVRTLHGLPLEAIASLRHYEESVAGLSPEEQAELALTAF